MSATEDAKFDILNLFKTFLIWTFWDSSNIIWDFSLWISMPMTWEASPKLFILNFWEINCFISYNKHKSLLASKISYTYKTKKIYFLPLALRYIHWSLMFSIKPHEAMTLCNLIYHYRKSFLVYI